MKDGPEQVRDGKRRTPWWSRGRKNQLAESIGYSGVEIARRAAVRADRIKMLPKPKDETARSLREQSIAEMEKERERDARWMIKEMEKDPDAKHTTTNDGSSLFTDAGFEKLFVEYTQWVKAGHEGRRQESTARKTADRIRSLLAFTKLSMEQLEDLIERFNNMCDRLIPQDRRPTIAEAIDISDAYPTTPDKDHRLDERDLAGNKKVLDLNEPYRQELIERPEKSIEPTFGRTDTIEERVDAAYNRCLETVLTVLMCLHESEKVRPGLHWLGDDGDAVAAHKGQDYGWATDVLALAKGLPLRVDGSVGVSGAKIVRNFAVLDKLDSSGSLPQTRLFIGGMTINNATVAHSPRLIAPMDRETLFKYITKIVSLVEALDERNETEYWKVRYELENDPHQLALIQLYLAQLAAYDQHMSARLRTADEERAGMYEEIRLSETQSKRRGELLLLIDAVNERRKEMETYLKSNRTVQKTLEKVYIERTAFLLTNEMQKFREKFQSALEAKDGDTYFKDLRENITAATTDTERDDFLHLLQRAKDEKEMSDVELFPLYAFLVENNIVTTGPSALTYENHDNRWRQAMYIFTHEEQLQELLKLPYSTAKKYWSDAPEDREEQKKIRAFFNKIRAAANVLEEPEVDSDDTDPHIQLASPITPEIGMIALKHVAKRADARSRADRFSERVRAAMQGKVPDFDPFEETRKLKATPSATFEAPELPKDIDSTDTSELQRQVALLEALAEYLRTDEGAALLKSK
jgi:hypothetical protein